MERIYPPLRRWIADLRASITSISREHNRSSRSWEKQHPEDPVGPVSEAAGLLFSEFNRLGVLEAQFYENDSAFENRAKLKPDPALRAHFESAIARAQTLARARLDDRLEESRCVVRAYVVLRLAGGLLCPDREAQPGISALHQRSVRIGSAVTRGLSTIATMRCSRPDSASTSSGAWPRRCAGSCGWEACRQTSRAGSTIFKPRLSTGTTWLRLRASCSPSLTCARKTKPRALELLSGLQREFPSNTLFPREIARLQSAR